MNADEGREIATSERSFLRVKFDQLIVAFKIGWDRATSAKFRSS